MKKVLVTILILTMLSSLTACSGGSSSTDTGKTEPAVEESTTEKEDVAEEVKIGIVTDVGIDESEFLQNMVVGLEDYTAKNEGIDIKIVEATDVAEYEPKVRALAEASYDIIITMNSGMAGATTSVAADYPDIIFGSQNGNIENLESYSNIEEFGPNRTETGFLAGVLAACMSESDTVGIVVGSDDPDLNAIAAGWQQGLVWANPEITDYLVYSNSFTDPTIGKELGLSLIQDKKCDVIGGAAGGTGVGVAQAAAEQGCWYVAWDVHYPDVFTDEQLELGSALNWFDVMYLAFIDDVIQGNYHPGEFVEYGADKGVCTFEYSENSQASDEAKAKVEEARELIVNHEIEISPIPLHK